MWWFLICFSIRCASKAVSTQCDASEAWEVPDFLLQDLIPCFKCRVSRSDQMELLNCSLCSPSLVDNSPCPLQACCNASTVISLSGISTKGMGRHWSLSQPHHLTCLRFLLIDGLPCGETEVPSHLSLLEGSLNENSHCSVQQLYSVSTLLSAFYQCSWFGEPLLFTAFPFKMPRWKT